MKERDPSAVDAPQSGPAKNTPTVRSAAADRKTPPPKDQALPAWGTQSRSTLCCQERRSQRGEKGRGGGALVNGPLLAQAWRGATVGFVCEERWGWGGATGATAPSRGQWSLEFSRREGKHGRQWVVFALELEYEGGWVVVLRIEG